MSTVAPAGLRIGDLARRAGTTPRTIRYYEELGLLPSVAERDAGRHRTYSEDDVERLEQLLRLKD
ncbi:MAG: MerR family transcriptional regulator, repressor of the yfmOP operon, partial [Solirubrobacteraceae bacterium]|nr:MerR family transcriptional regulator, repressor of the yfmOP operon [Solirubrobacteraceae bacterium]